MTDKDEAELADHAEVARRLLEPTALFGRADILKRPSAAPSRPGVYAWYFRVVPPGVPSDGCHRHDGMTLLYVGVSPTERAASAAPSNSTLKQRLRTHYAGNASSSTLRLSLGCLLAERLGISLRRTGRKERMTFTNDGEHRLDEWMMANTMVTWVEMSAPWQAEKALLHIGPPLPLNLDGNPDLARTTPVRTTRAAARRDARGLPVIVHDMGHPRSGRKLRPERWLAVETEENIELVRRAAETLQKLVG